MGYPTPIEWTDATLNLHGGCSIHSPGCNNCYSQTLCGTRLAQHPLYAGTTSIEKGRPIFNGHLTSLPPDDPKWAWPINWKGAKHPRLGTGKPSLIFVDDMSDLYHEKRPFDEADRVFAIGALSRHVLQVLTKRADRMCEHLTLARSRFGSETLGTYEHIYNAMGRLGKDVLNDPHPYRKAIPFGLPWPMPNMWLGFSAERQKEFDQRWRYMRDLAEAGWTVFVSIEPMIGPVVLPDDFLAFGKRIQVITGGESGRRARAPNPDWFRSLRDQCVPAGVAFLFKQFGEWAPQSACPEAWNPNDCGLQFDCHQFPSAEGDGRNFVHRVGKKRAGRILDGREWNQFPEPA